MNIRRAVESDFGAMWPIFQKVVSDEATYVFASDTSYEDAFAYWFGTGVVSYVAEDNGQIVGMYKLIPNQNIGAYYVGFMPQWITREYLARRGSVKFRPYQTVAARCPLLGYALESLKIDGYFIPKGLLQTNMQLEVGEEAYDRGAAMLTDFFAKELRQFQNGDLSAEGRRIIQCFFDGGTVEDYQQLI